MSDFSADLAYQLQVVPLFNGLLLLVFVIFKLWTLLGRSVDSIGFVPETFTTIDPLMALDVTLSANSFEPSFDVFGGVRLIGIIDWRLAGRFVVLFGS